MTRFRGFDDGGSDKVPGDIDPPPHAPEPSSLVLGGLGLLSLAGYGWRRKKAAD